MISFIFINKSLLKQLVILFISLCFSIVSNAKILTIEISSQETDKAYLQFFSGHQTIVQVHTFKSDGMKTISLNMNDFKDKKIEKIKLCFDDDYETATGKTFAESIYYVMM